MSNSTQHHHVRSQLDELSSLLEGCATPVRPPVPCVSSLADTPPPPLEWAALPRAVDVDSAALGVSTRRLTAKQQAKQRPVDAAKVAARVARKRAQVESFLLVLRPLLAAAAARQQQQLHIVDFGCGTGNLLLPLAALFPGACCRFTGVDMKPAALRLLQQRAAAAGLSNVAAAGGMIEQFSQPFDVALALHACGNATDHVLQMAVDQGAAFVVSPCCVGKLRFSLTGGSSFHSQPVVWTPTLPGDRPVQRQAPDPTGAATPLRQPEQHHQQQQAAGVEAAAAAGVVRKLRHPRSDWLLGQLQPEPERHFATLAKVADAAHAPAELPELAEALQQRASVADTCKRFVELDRCAAAAEAGYAVGLFKVLQAASMAKSDLLVGLPLQQHATATPAAVGSTEAAANATMDERGQQQPAAWLCECGRALAGSGRLLTAAAFQGAVQQLQPAEREPCAESWKTRE